MNIRVALRHGLSRPGAVPLLFALFLVPRLLVVMLDVTPVSDALWYYSRAKDIADGLGYSEGGVPTAYWPPGWPMVMSVLFRVFGASMGVVKAFNVACTALTAWLTFDLGRRLFKSDVAGSAAVLLLALYPNSIGYVPLALTEVFYTALLLGGCWLLITRQSAAHLVLGGLVFGFSVLVKAQSLLVVPLIFAILWLRDGGNLRALVANGFRCLMVLLVAIIVMLPWTLRNFRVFGEVVPVSTNGGMTLLTGNNPSARGGYTEDDPLVTTLVRTVATQLQVDREARARAQKWIAENPSRFVALMPLKLFRLWAPDGEAEWAYQDGYARYDQYRLVFRTVRVINQIYYTALLLGFAWAAALMFLRRATISQRAIDWWALPYALALFPSLIALVFSGQSRFHYPVMPFVAMSCAGLLTRQATRTAPESSSSPS